MKSFVEDFKTVCIQSGLTMDELATIYGYTRQTIYNWRQGHPPVRQRALQTAAVYNSGLLAAISKGVLPLRAPSTGDRQRRIETIKQKLYLAAAPTI